MSAALYLYHQSVLPEKLYKRIPTRHTAFLLKHLLDDDIEFGAAESWIIPAVILSLLDNQRFYGILSKFVVILAIVK